MAVAYRISTLEFQSREIWESDTDSDGSTLTEDGDLVCYRSGTLLIERWRERRAENCVSRIIGRRFGAHN